MGVIRGFSNGCILVPGIPSRGDKKKVILKMEIDPPIYNSRIIKVFLKYLEQYYPLIDTESILSFAGMANYEVEDPAHWFKQNQVDLFYESLLEQTNNPNISREVGQYTASSDAMGAARQYILGLMNVASAYHSMEKLYPIMSRAATVKTRKLSSRKVEITSIPNPGVKEKHYQCENRIGTFEAIAKLFTGNLAKIEHPSCLHEGDEHCRYIVTWEDTPLIIWTRIRNYFYPLGLLASCISLVYLPITEWFVLTLSCISVGALLSFYSANLAKTEIAKTVEAQGDAAKSLLDEINIRYNDSMLVQEIGQAISTIMDVDRLVEAVVKVMKKRLDFDRGMIMLSNSEKTRLLYKAGYGYAMENEQILLDTAFHLDRADSRGIFVLAFREQKPYLVSDINEIEKQFSKRSLDLIKKMGVRSMLCVPIVYEKESMGILAVDNTRSRRPLTQSDISLLVGVGSQTAISIINALSFQKIQESEKKYRDLVENANSIILRMDIDGNISFFNEFAQKFFGFAEKEIIGTNVIGTIFPDTQSSKQSLDQLKKTLQKNPEGPVASEEENILRSGISVSVAWTHKPIFDSDGRFKEILSIGNDITEAKRSAMERESLKKQFIQAQKMEAIGTLAGGIAHDFNNILQAIVGYTQLLMMGKKQDHPEYKKLETIQKSVKMGSDLTRRLLIFGRKLETELKPLDLNHCVTQISKMLKRTIPKMIKIDLLLEGDLKIINADINQIEQVIMNLSVNARDAMPEGGKLIFETKNVLLDCDFSENHVDVPPGNYVLLKVVDSGHGMDEETVERIFEPFFTTKEAGKGTGLGLAMVYGTVKSHNGSIACESEPGKGTSFSLYFPATEEGIVEQPPDDKEIQVVGGHETILLVDDDINVQEFGEEILSKMGYTVMTANDGESALRIYKNNLDAINLIILDLIMPGMGGKNCLERLIRINPEAKVVIASGYSIDGATRALIEKFAKGFLGKPYDVNDMLRAVRKALDDN